MIYDLISERLDGFTKKRPGAAEIGRRLSR
jgi:hypothetical protein